MPRDGQFATRRGSKRCKILNLTRALALSWAHAHKWRSTPCNSSSISSFHCGSAAHRGPCASVKVNTSWQSQARVKVRRGAYMAAGFESFFRPSVQGSAKFF